MKRASAFTVVTSHPRKRPRVVVDLTQDADLAATAANIAAIAMRAANAAASAANAAARSAFSIRAARAALAGANVAALGAAMAIAAANNAITDANKAAMFTQRPLTKQQSTGSGQQCGEEVALQMANDALKKHGLDVRGWTVEFDRAKRRLGCTKFRTRKITLSRFMVNAMSQKIVNDTILHEIAHALVGPRHGHDSVWKAKAREVGCSATTCGPRFEAPLKYVFKCQTPGCPGIVKFDRISKRRQHLFQNRSNCKRCKQRDSYVRQ